jgi:putative hemolysin
LSTEPHSWIPATRRTIMSNARACAGRGPEPDLESSHGKRIVDALIGERAPTLYRFAPTRWAMRHLLQPVLHYREAVETAERIAGLGGHEIMALGVSRLGLQVRTLGLYRLPSRGRVILAPNHPTGLADGVAVWEALRRVREDILILANRDAIRLAAGLADLMIPVEWVKCRRNPGDSRRILADVGNAFRAEEAIVIFPSGRIAHMTVRGLRERPWLSTVVTLARRFEAPILPVHIRARNSWLFYGLSQLSAELRDVTLFHELLNKGDRPFELTFGDLVDPQDLPPDPAEAVRLLQHYVEHDLPRASRLRPTLPRRRKLAARAPLT